jgi:hypothetical protein
MEGQLSPGREGVVDDAFHVSREQCLGDEWGPGVQEMHSLVSRSKRTHDSWRLGIVQGA